MQPELCFSSGSGVHKQREHVACNQNYAVSAAWLFIQHETSHNNKYAISTPVLFIRIIYKFHASELCCFVGGVVHKQHEDITCPLQKLCCISGSVVHKQHAQITGNMNYAVSATVLFMNGMNTSHSTGIMLFQVLCYS